MTGPPGTSGTPGPGTQSGIPTCYRHPGRETYVSCVRCGRPACPDCLRSAAVGQQCVDCIREASRGTRQPSGAFGGRVVVSGAPVTWTLVGINVLLFLVELVHSSIGLSWAMLGGVISNGQVIGVVGGQWYRLITSAFLPAARARLRTARHRVQHVGADLRRARDRAAARPPALSRRLPGQRGRRRGDVLLPRAAERAGARCVRSDLRPVRCLVRAGQAAAHGRQAGGHADRAEPRDQLHRPGHRLAGPSRRADRRQPR